MSTPTDAPGDSALVRRLLGGEFAITAEIVPPLSARAEDVVARARSLAPLVDAVNVTDGAGARIAMSSLAAAAVLAREGIEPVLQFTCRDRNRLALQADMIGAAVLNIRNILILRGDDPKSGDEPDAKAVFDYESRDLVTVASLLSRDGGLPSGRTVGAPCPFFIGVADTPMDRALGWTPEGLRAKADAGAHFVQTQLCYDAALIERYAALLVESGLANRLFVLLGTGPIKSAGQALWMRKNLWGVAVPDSVISRLDAAKDPVQEGIRLCAELIALIRRTPGLAGVHLMAPGNAAALPAAIEAAQARA